MMIPVSVVAVAVATIFFVVGFNLGAILERGFWKPLVVLYEKKVHDWFCYSLQLQAENYNLRLKIRHLQKEEKGVGTCIQ